MKIKFIKPPTDVYDVTVGKEYEVIGDDGMSYAIESDEGIRQDVYYAHTGIIVVNAEEVTEVKTPIHTCSPSKCLSHFRLKL